MLEKQRRGLISEAETYDPKTGEVEEGSLVWIPRKARSQFGDGWFQMAQQTMKTINAHRKDLGLEGMVVINALMARLDWENFMQISQTEIAEELDMRPSNVSRAIRKLLDLGFIKAGPKVGRSYTYQLHPELAWKGKPKKHFTAQQMAKKAGWKVIDGGGTKEDPDQLDMFRDLPPTSEADAAEFARLTSSEPQPET